MDKLNKTSSLLSGLNKFEIIIILLLSILPVAIAYLSFPEFMGDDTFIHVGFIKGLIETGKFTFTGTETYGTTSPLWVILNALFSLLTKNPVLSIRILSGVFSIITILLLNFVLKIISINFSLRIFLLLSFALNPFFIKWSISGMEASAVMSALIMCMILVLHKKYEPLNILGFVMGLSFLLRPEFLGVFVISLFYFLGIKKKFSFIISFSLQFLLVVTSWFIYAWIHFGTIIPNTFRAKAKDNFLNIDVDKLIRNIKVLLAGNIPEFLAIAAAVIMILFIKRKSNIKNLFSKTLIFFNKQEFVLLILWISGFYFFYILKNVTILSRYSLMFVPTIIFLTAILLNNLKTIFNRFQYNFVLGFYVTSIFLINNFITFNTVVPSNNNFANGFQKTFREISEIIKNDNTIERKTVALTDVGIVGTYSTAKVFDLAGLVDKDRFNYNTYYDYVIAKKPIYLVLREEADISEVVPESVVYKVLYKKKVPGFGINTPEPRTVTLYKLFW